MLEAEYEKEREKIEGKEDDRLKEERIQTLQTIFQRAWRYQERGMLEEIILGFVQKKTAMLQNARTKGELQEISKPPKPVYNGNVFTTGKYDTEEGSKIILADEPTSGLDKDNEAIVMSLLKKLNERGITIIMVTHNLNLCDYFSRVIDVEKYR